MCIFKILCKYLEHISHSFFSEFVFSKCKMKYRLPFNLVPSHIIQFLCMNLWKVTKILPKISSFFFPSIKSENCIKHFFFNYFYMIIMLNKLMHGFFLMNSELKKWIYLSNIKSVFKNLKIHCPVAYINYILLKWH